MTRAVGEHDVALIPSSIRPIPRQNRIKDTDGDVDFVTFVIIEGGQNRIRASPQLSRSRPWSKHLAIA